MPKEGTYFKELLSHKMKLRFPFYQQEAKLHLHPHQELPPDLPPNRQLPPPCSFLGVRPPPFSSSEAALISVISNPRNHRLQRTHPDSSRKSFGRLLAARPSRLKTPRGLPAPKNHSNLLRWRHLLDRSAVKLERSAIYR